MSCQRNRRLCNLLDGVLFKDGNASLCLQFRFALSSICGSKTFHLSWEGPIASIQDRTEMLAKTGTMWRSNENKPFVGEVVLCGGRSDGAPASDERFIADELDLTSHRSCMKTMQHDTEIKFLFLRPNVFKKQILPQPLAEQFQIPTWAAGKRD